MEVWKCDWVSPLGPSSGWKCDWVPPLQSKAMAGGAAGGRKIRGDNDKKNKKEGEGGET